MRRRMKIYYLYMSLLLLCLVTAFIVTSKLKISYFQTNPSEKQPEISRSCQPMTHIMFLKTHKTGSTTVQNILLRYADRNNLSVALSNYGPIHLGYPKLFSAKFVKRSATGQKFDIMAHHLRFNLPEVSKVLHSDTFYFSIIRHPVSVMESAFMYCNKESEIFRKVKDLNEFMKAPWTYYKPNWKNSFFAKNLLWYDFGFDHNHNDDNEYFESVVTQIESNFQLILINEYFDESMILLKETLCWSMSDVVYFILNSRGKSSIQNLTTQTVNMMTMWNSLDWKLYLHFNRTFWRRISETIGIEKLKKEVQLLRLMQKELLNTCIKNGIAVEPSKVENISFLPFQPNKLQIFGYNLKTDLNISTRIQCQRMVLSEKVFTQQLYARQNT